MAAKITGNQNVDFASNITQGAGFPTPDFVFL